MAQRPWYLSGSVVWLACLVLPPVGLVLLWLRQGTRLGVKILGSLGVAAVAVAHLFLFYGLRAEMGGAGVPKFFTFSKPESHYAELDKSRAEVKAVPAPAPLVEVPPRRRSRIGLTSVGRVETAAMTRCPSGRIGRPEDCPGCGNSR